MLDVTNLQKREFWAARRVGMERSGTKHTPSGRHRRHWGQFKLLCRVGEVLFRLTGLEKRGLRNALDIRLNRMELGFDNLPADFDGYTVLHLSDLHIDGMEGLAERLASLVARIEVDLCILTGDYRFRVHGGFEPTMRGLTTVRRAIRARDGIYATLGNHDTVDMVAPMERLGINVMANDTVTIGRGDGVIHLTGLDDVHYYYTDEAGAALHDAPGGFRILAVHSPEIVEPAARAGVSLYLTGHTHCGQISLPGGRPVITHAEAERRHCRGLWRHRGMTGYTSPGIGVSGFPARFNTRGEATLFTLRTNPAG